MENIYHNLIISGGVEGESAQRRGANSFNQTLMAPIFRTFPVSLMWDNVNWYFSEFTLLFFNRIYGENGRSEKE